MDLLRALLNRLSSKCRRNNNRSSNRMVRLTLLLRDILNSSKALLDLILH